MIGRLGDILFDFLRLCGVGDSDLLEGFDFFMLSVTPSLLSLEEE